MARTIHSYTDPVMDFLFPLAGDEDRLFWKLARVAYLPILATAGWNWGALTGFAMESDAFGYSSVNLGVDGTRMLWTLLALSLLSGWMLFRTSSGPMGGFKEVLVMGNMLGTGLLLLVGLVNMIQIVLIAMGSFYVGALLGLCWLIVAGFLLATVLWSN